MLVHYIIKMPLQTKVKRPSTNKFKDVKQNEKIKNTSPIETK
jgi:hypothetical protein